MYRNTIPAFPFSGKLHWVKADVLEIDSLEEAMQNVQQVYHCAAIVSFNPKQKELLNKVNVEGTANVVNACLTAGVKITARKFRFCFRKNKGKYGYR